MTRIRHLAHALLALALVAATAQARTLTTFNVEELGRQPGLVELSPNFLSIIEFEDAVQSAATGRSDLIQTSVDGNSIILRPTRSAGQTDLIVQVGGRTTMFILRISEQNGSPRRYLVTTPAPPLPGTPRLGSRTSTPLLAETTPEPAPAELASAEPAPEPAEPESAPPAEAKERATETTINGDSVPYEFSTTIDVRGSDEIVFRYTLKNTGSNIIANDNGRLNISATDGRALEYSIVRMNPDGLLNRVNPGKTEYGTIRISNPPAKDIQIAWPIVELGPGTTHTIDEIVLSID